MYLGEMIIGGEGEVGGGTQWEGKCGAVVNGGEKGVAGGISNHRRSDSRSHFY